MPNLNLSPSVRSALIIIGTVIGAIIPVLATAGVPLIVTAILGAIVFALGALGIIPPQTGGTQVGVASPSLVTPPAVQTPDEGEGVVVETANPNLNLRAGAPDATPHGYNDAHLR